MEKQRQQLTEGMQRLCDIANRIVAAPGALHPLERDLLLEALRHLYSVALQMPCLPEEVATAKEEKAEPQAPKEPDHDDMAATVVATMAAMAPAPDVTLPDQVFAPDDDIPFAAEEEYHEEPAEEALAADVEAPAADAEPAEPQAEEPATAAVEFYGMPVIEEPAEEEASPEPQPEHEEHTPEPQPEPQQPEKPQASLLDYLKHPREEHATTATIGDALAAYGTKAAVEDLGQKKVSDLRTVININDKFSFMSELFHNNMKAYNDFILQLNSTESRDEAMRYVENMAAQYQWDSESLAVKSFWKIFNKKF